MLPNTLSGGGVRPAPPCDVARCRTFVPLYSVIQNSMGLRGCRNANKRKNSRREACVSEHAPKAARISTATEPRPSRFC